MPQPVYCQVCGIKTPDARTTDTPVGPMHLCASHRQQMANFGMFIDSNDDRIRKMPTNPYEFLPDGSVKVYTTPRNSTQINGYFIIDAEDLEKILRFHWSAGSIKKHDKTNPLRSYCNIVDPITGQRRKYAVHHMVLDHLPQNTIIDHRDHDPHNNRKSNLRVATYLENARNGSLQSNNKTGYAGIMKIPTGWRAVIQMHKNKIELGRYKKLEDACYARYIAEKILFEDFRNTDNDNTLVPTANQSENKLAIYGKVINILCSYVIKHGVEERMK